jgi:UDP-N-acetylglucosamine 4-epimerase
VACGERTDLNTLIDLLKQSLSKHDKAILDIETTYGPLRVGDVPHSLASIDKAKKILDYQPQFNLKEGLEEAVEWYWSHL